MQDMDLDLLRCFDTVAQLRNFTAAGTRLGRSQSAVSIRIKKLEELVGAQLLIRNNQDVKLTTKGEALLSKARRLLEDSERLMAEIRKPSIAGHMRIGLLEYIAPHRLPDIMSALQRKLPGAELHFHVGLSASLKTALSQGQIDMALALHDPKGAASQVIAIDPLVWVESTNARKEARNTPLELCLMQAPCIYRQAAMTVLRNKNVAHREVMTANSVPAVQNAVRSGLGVTVLGASCLGAGLRPAGRLQQMAPLPDVRLGLHGNDPRKAEVAALLQDVLSVHMRGIA